MTRNLGSELSAPERLAQAWENAYRQYGETSNTVTRTPDDRAAAQQMASASRGVARCWRDIAARQTLPRWALAALESAAEAFETQARSWDVRATDPHARSA